MAMFKSTHFAKLKRHFDIKGSYLLRRGADEAGVCLRVPPGLPGTGRGRGRGVRSHPLKPGLDVPGHCLTFVSSPSINFVHFSLCPSCWFSWRWSVSAVSLSWSASPPYSYHSRKLFNQDLYMWVTWGCLLIIYKVMWKSYVIGPKLKLTDVTSWMTQAISIFLSS